jgi:hypothetical protein
MAKVIVFCFKVFSGKRITNLQNGLNNELG